MKTSFSAGDRVFYFLFLSFETALRHWPPEGVAFNDAAPSFSVDFIYVGAGSDAYRGVGGSVSVDATEAILTKLFGEVF